MLLAAAEWFRVPVRWNRYTHRGEKSPIPYYREPSDRSFFPTPRPQNPLRGGQPRREVFLYGSLFLSVPLEYSHKEQHHPECSYRSEPGSSRIRQNFQLCIHLKSSHHPSDWRKEYHPAKFLHGDIFFSVRGEYRQRVEFYSKLPLFRSNGRFCRHEYKIRETWLLSSVRLQEPVPQSAPALQMESRCGHNPDRSQYSRRTAPSTRNRAF